LKTSLELVGHWDAHKGDLKAGRLRLDHPTMAGAIEQFCGKWSYGFGHLADDIENLVAALEQACEVYSATEAGLADGWGGT
jgi:hypothetical protein